MQLRCTSCDWQQVFFNSCGHRSCPRCQNHDTTRWLERQMQKLLPVEYFMVTFTLPYELRALARQHQATVYCAMFACAASTLKSFGANDTKLGADMGMTAVLHTHSRRLDYHPHIHLVVPGGCLNRRRRQWKKLHGHYLFNEFALAKVFRGRLLEALRVNGIIQAVLGVVVSHAVTTARPAFRCIRCKSPMLIAAFIPPSWRST